MEAANTNVIIAVIIGLVIIECIAMALGFNGTLRIIIVAGMFGLAGYTLPNDALKKVGVIK